MCRNSPHQIGTKSSQVGFRTTWHPMRRPGITTWLRQRWTRSILWTCKIWSVHRSFPVSSFRQNASLTMRMTPAACSRTTREQCARSELKADLSWTHIGILTHSWRRRWSMQLWCQSSSKSDVSRKHFPILFSKKKTDLERKSIWTIILARELMSDHRSRPSSVLPTSPIGKAEMEKASLMATPDSAKAKENSLPSSSAQVLWTNLFIIDSTSSWVQRPCSPVAQQ